MFVADRLLYLELQKTGGSHILHLLKQYTDGGTVGKHNRLQEMPAVPVIGSIRNPWDWYVSLWAYGVGGKGAIRMRTAKRLNFNYYNRTLPKAMGKNWLTPAELLTCLRYDVVKPTNRWQHAYANSDDPVLFRAWIKLLLDPERRFDIGEGFGFSPLSHHAGLLTFRYLRLFTVGDSVFLDESLGSPENIAAYDKKNNIVKGMIRTECLEEDFIKELLGVGVPLSEDQQLSIINKEEGKTNASQRKSSAYYYDNETAALVAKRDCYIIDKYGYQSPV